MPLAVIWFSEEFRNKPLFKRSHKLVKSDC